MRISEVDQVRAEERRESVPEILDLQRYSGASYRRPENDGRREEDNLRNR